MLYERIEFGPKIIMYSKDKETLFHFDKDMIGVHTSFNQYCCNLLGYWNVNNVINILNEVAFF